MAKSTLPKPPASAQFLESERADITRILSNTTFGPGTRAAHLMRQHGRRLKFSARAKLIYVLLAGFVGADKNRFSVALKTLAGWANCTPRSAQRAIRELTRTGPLPLLLETPGRPGRVSEYQLVWAPFEVAAQQARDAERKREHRIAASRHEVHETVVAVARAHQDDSAMTDAAITEALKPILRKRNYLQPTRAVPAPAKPLPPEQQAGLDAMRDRMRQIGIVRPRPQSLAG